VGANGKVIPEYVAEHYGELSVNALFLDVLSHYEKNVLPQVEAIVHSHTADLSTECLIIEGSALWPGFVANLVGENAVKALWLTASDQLFRTRIFSESNFYNVSEDEKHLIQKFLDRTLFYNKHMREEVERLGFICIDVESVSMADELSLIRKIQTPELQHVPRQDCTHKICCFVFARPQQFDIMRGELHRFSAYFLSR